ncbi:MAG: tRNA pseudouridine(38-40) synthase TruA [Candidatus Omnitrophota bacterium]|nr:tRNA pseudouridine(38-40) synthase TruA [Candidatus Omnitrophota bacterium]MDZ4241519.1 tRNA pseudouridine(38-40) synthase TruA [Candidatus Omnitrophota bacterium]
MPRNIKLTIEYDGTEFEGWQVQGPRHRTVQGEIQKALRKIFKRDIVLVGSGRTDSGTHALGQAANFKAETSMPAEEMVRALNANLPADIAVLAAAEVPDGFHAQFNAKSKTYRYTILNRPVRCACLRKLAFHVPYPLDATLMRREGQVLVGRKDFRSFMASDTAEKMKPGEKDTVRTIRRLSVKKEGPWISIDVESDGFLYKMVRNIVGTLIEIGSGKLPSGSMRKILLQKDRGYAGDTAPARGLCLVTVRYPDKKQKARPGK